MVATTAGCGVGVATLATAGAAGAGVTTTFEPQAKVNRAVPARNTRLRLRKPVFIDKSSSK